MILTLPESVSGKVSVMSFTLILLSPFLSRRRQHADEIEILKLLKSSPPYNGRTTEAPENGKAMKQQI